MAPSITEQNIKEIELAFVNTSRVFRPKDGTVKWFKDELDQVWLKFVPAESIGGLEQVWPGHRVVRVIYAKK